MKVDLLPHNQVAYEKIKSAIADNKKKIAISHATGTGKSYLITKLFEDYRNEKKLVLVPSTYISDQIQKLFEKYSIQNADIILYQKLIKMDDVDIAAMDYGMIALDEYHHDTSKVWGEKVRKLIDTHPESFIFGTSATPIRSDGVNTIDELFEGNCASDLPLSESIAKKIVPLPKYVGALYTLDDELEKLRKKVENATNTKEEKQEFYKKINAMRSQIEKSYGMPIILNKNIKNKEGKYIVFCKNKKHLAEIKDTVIGWFKTAGFKDINAYEVYSDYESKDVEYKAFCNDTSHSLHLLFCVDMLNEGLHLENISGVLLLRPTRSSIVWHQQIGRAIEANNINTPVIIDAVNNFSSAGQGMKLFKEIRGAIEREKTSNPNFDDSGLEDIDTFFVLENVIEVQEMFKEIEGRLQSNFDLYIKALKQYKEREGDCLVSQKHVEAVDGVNVPLGYWVSNMRNTKNGKGKALLTEERIKQLEGLGFIWDELKYRFEKNVNYCIEFYEKYGRKPNKESDDNFEKKLGCFWNLNRNNKNLSQWKLNLLLQIPSFFDKEKISTFDKFYENALMYKERYENVEFTKDSQINGYNLYSLYYNLKAKKDKLTLIQKKKLKDIGIDLSVDKVKEMHNKKIQIAREAVSKGVIISTKNPFYKGINFYSFKNTNSKNFTKDELEIMNKLVPQPGCMRPVKVIDIKNNQTYMYPSIRDAGKALHNEFHIVKSDKGGMSAIIKRLRDENKSPVYKGFQFEYADTNCNFNVRK